ncbi:hypothetical protein RZS08_11045 [Arthrospira platensis SPKY1]|nr:hypothetical protein [Arthrospira platensis SPKY1]
MSKQIEAMNQPAFPVGSGDMRDPTGMTLRQYAAIHLKVPNSGTDWLDEMIVESNRNELAARAMQGYASDPDWRSDMGPTETAFAAYRQADDMLKAREQ